MYLEQKKKKENPHKRYIVYKKFTLNIKQDRLKEMEKGYIILIKEHPGKKYYLWNHTSKKENYKQ